MLKSEPQNTYLVSGSNDMSVRVWNVKIPKLEHLFIIKGHSDDINVLIELVDNVLVSGCWDNTIKFWDVL